MVKNKIFYSRYGSILRFVDCYSHQTGNIIPDTVDTKRVAGPLALNEMSIALADTERSFLKNKSRHLVIFDSLSTLIMYSNSEMVARFIQVLIAKVKNQGGSIFFTIEQGLHDSKAVITMEHLMDGIIEVKKDRNKILFKVKGQNDDKWNELN